MFILKTNRPVKWLGLIFGVVILNIIVFSPGLLGTQIARGHALESASAVTLLFISLMLVLYGSYSLLIKPPEELTPSRLETYEDYITGLNRYRNVKALKNDVLLAIEQLERIKKKKSALRDVLIQRFDASELSFRKFESVIQDAEKLFLIYIRGILYKLSVFDASEYKLFADKQQPPPFTTTLVQKKSAFYKEYFVYVAGCLNSNEEILLKLDQLLLELSRLDSMDHNAVENMPCMKELSTLISQTKLYQQ